MQTRTYDETKWKLVPLEPTKRQMDVARPIIRLGNMEEVHDIYRAMVAAAEEPPREPGPQRPSGPGPKPTG